MRRTNVLKGLLCVILSCSFAGAMAQNQGDGQLMRGDTVRYLGTVALFDPPGLVPWLRLSADSAAGRPTLMAEGVFVASNQRLGEMQVRTVMRDAPIQLYDGRVQFTGHLTITATSIVGGGVLTMGNVEVTSSAIAFLDAQTWRADSAEVVLYERQPFGRRLFEYQGGSVTGDMARQTLTMHTYKHQGAIGYFPHQRWEVTCDVVELDLAAQSMSFSQDFGNDGRYMRLMERKGPAHSAAISCKGLAFDIVQQTIALTQADFMQIADARILPADGRVTLGADGEIQDLQGAIIDANRSTGYHRWWHADLHFGSRSTYTAQATYDYPYGDGRSPHLRIPCALHLQGDSMTVAECEVTDPTFHLNAGMDYQGKVDIVASDPQYRLQGQLSLDLANPAFAGKTFAIQGWVHPDSILLPMAMPGLASGIYCSAAQQDYYSIWQEAPRAAQDKVVANAAAYLTYDPSKAVFCIGSQARLRGEDERGAVSCVDRAGLVVTTVGKLDLSGDHAGSKWRMDLAGEWRHNRSTNEIRTNLVARIDLPGIPAAAWKILAQQVWVGTAMNDRIDWASDPLLHGIAEFIDPDSRRFPKHMQALHSQIVALWPGATTDAGRHIPADLLLANVEFQYDSAMHAFWSHSPVGILTLGNQAIEKFSTSRTQIEYRIGQPDAQGATTADTLRIYLAYTDENWVYFEQFGNVTHTVSSDTEGYNACFKHGKHADMLLPEHLAYDFSNRFLNAYVLRLGRGRR